MHRKILRRLNGIGLLMLSLGPPVIVAVGLGITAKLAIDVVEVTRAKTEAIVDTVNQQVTPRIAAIRAGYEAIEADAARLDDQLSQTFATLSSLQDIRIEAGQFGSTAGQHIRFPDNDLWIGPLKIGGGQIADNDLPGISLPSQPVSIPVTPLRDAFAPLGVNGPLGQGITAAQAELGKTVGAVKDLAAPLDQVIGTVESWFAPLTNTAGQLAWIAGLVAAAVLVLLLAYVIAGVTFAVRRRSEAGAAYRGGGEIGYVLWVHRTMVLDGIARVRGKNPADLRPPSPRELQHTIQALQAELQNLRRTVEAREVKTPELVH
jgi:prefoldin subunit 5